MANNLKILKSYLSPLEAQIEEVVRLSSDALSKLREGTLTPEDIHTFHWALDNFLMHKKIDTNNSPNPTKGVKDQPVNFNFNGESFEAYEILGLPSGLPVDFARAHFEIHYSKLEAGDKVLYESAISAIESRRHS